MIKMRGTNERMGGKPQAQENKSKLIQARKTPKERDRDLTAAIRRCHIELKRKSLSEIEASKNAVEVAWREHMQASCWYSTYAGWNPFGWKNLEEQPEEARQAWYEWQALTEMMEQVVEKAEEYLESATKENSCGEHNDDGDDGGELDAKVELQRWAMAVRYREAQVQAIKAKEAPAKVNEVALEVSAVNEVNDVNEVTPEVSTVNKVNEVNVSEANVSKVNVSKVNVNAYEAKFDVNAEAKVEVFGMKEVKFDVNSEAMVVSEMKELVQSDELTMMKVTKQSRCVNWDPGEVVNAKDQMEMLNVEEVAKLMNNDKVVRSGNVKTMMFVYALYSWMLYTSDALVALCMVRFVNSFSPLSVVELSDYG